jgi:hypothetical protein
MTKCSAKKLNGSPCKVRVLAGSDYCFFHDPEKAPQRQVAQSKGGRKRKDLPLPSAPPDNFDLSTPEGMRVCIQYALNRVVRGEIDTKTVYAIAYLLESARKLYDTTELKREMERWKDLFNAKVEVVNPTIIRNYGIDTSRV